MAKFRDRNNREWVVAINIGGLRRIKDALGRDVLAVGDDGIPAGFSLIADPIGLVDALYILCAAGAGVSPEDFAAGFDGDVLEAAGAAYIEALIDFFPGRQRKIWRPLAESAARKMAKADAEMEAALPKILEKIESETQSGG